ncbi:MAG: hypothetical protein IKJ97_04880 [Bacteroidaceae bacterium]|nr:hypothetical protein [Bacteroidaceae bacterium]
MKPSDAKTEFQNVAIEFMDEFNASEFENVMELAEYIGRTYSEYETDEAEEWLDECLESLYIENDSSSEDYDVYETIYRLSAFKGKFVAEDGRLVKYNSDNLSLHVKDQNGKPCEITLTAAGDVKRVLCSTGQIWEGSYNTGTGEHDEYIKEEYIIWLDVPEKITIVLTQDGKKLLEAVINTDLSSMKGDEFNLSKDKYNVSANLYFNGYTFDVKRVHYENNKESSVEFEFRHGSKVLLNSTLAVTPEILASVFEDDYDYDDGYSDDEDEDGSVNFKNNLLTVNVLGRMQAKLSCNNLQALLEALEYCEDENTADVVNNHIAMKLYLNGSQDSFATIQFECEADEWYDGYETYTDYYLVPVIVFNDASRHRLYEYFNESDFENVINAFEQLLQEFEKLVEDSDIDF